MDIELIRTTEKQLRDIATNPQIHTSVVLPNAVMRITASIVQIAQDVEKQYPYVSNRLNGLRDGLFPLVQTGFNTQGYNVNLATFGQVVELLDFLIHESAAPDQDMWSLIHPRIINASKSLYLDGHWTNAATDAFVEVNTRVKNLFKIVSPNANVPDGVTAMTTVFSPNRPLIKIGDLNDQICHDKQFGLMNMLQGAISALRNPKCHDNEEIITKEEAMRRLMFASTLMCLIDEAVVYSNVTE